MAKNEQLNISELSKKYTLDRATVKRRLEDAGIEPVYKRAKETRYELTPEVEELLTRIDADIDAEKLRKTKAEADIKELEARVKKGELVSVQECTDLVQRLFGSMYTEIAVRFPRRVAVRASRAENSTEVAAVLSDDLKRVFTTLREDFRQYLPDDGKAKTKAKAAK